MDTIRFATNLNNKLNCIIIADIRESKQDGFWRTGKKYEAHFKNETEPFKIVQLIDGIAISDMEHISEFHFYTTMGYDKQEALKILQRLQHNKELSGRKEVLLIFKTLHTFREIPNRMVQSEEFSTTANSSKTKAA